MSRHAPISQSIRYIETHLTAEATVERTAAAAGYSRHHFSRTFLAVTGLTPTSYLRKRRVSEAARELVTTSKRIVDIALDYQFGSQEAFTRSFKKEFGVNPGLYRKQGRLHRLWGKISLGVSNLLYPGKGINPSPKLFMPEEKLATAIILPSLQPSLQPSPQLNLLGRASLNPMSPINIRLAHRQDMRDICRLYQELHEVTGGGTPEQAQFVTDSERFDASPLALTLQKQVDAEAFTIWVAERNGQVVGVAEIYICDTEQSAAAIAHRHGYLQRLVVKRELRGQGIDAQLQQAAEAWSHQHGATELRLETWDSEQGSRDFYTHQGYRTLPRTLVRKL